MKSTILAAIALSALGLAGPVSAGNYGTDITIFDGDRTTQGIAAPYEDNETEPGMVQSQEWDLEGIFLHGNTLTMIGGFDFINGVPGFGPNNAKDFTSGDLFFSTDATYGRPLSGTMYVVNAIGSTTTTVYDPLDNGNGQKNVTSSFGYEYVLDIDWAALTFSIVKLDADDATTTVYYHLNEDGSPSSNPWKYFANGEILGQGTVTNLGMVTDSGFAGMREENKLSNPYIDTHYGVSFDLSSFFSVTGLQGSDFYAHFTMGCGNDNLMGHGTAPVPEPTTLLLLGSGMAMLGALTRRKGIAS